MSNQNGGQTGGNRPAGKVGGGEGETEGKKLVYIDFSEDNESGIGARSESRACGKTREKRRDSQGEEAI